MKQLDFEIKSTAEIEKWLEKAKERMPENDFNHVATLAFNLANMDEFIFGNDEVSDKFMHYQAQHYYGGVLH